MLTGGSAWVGLLFLAAVGGVIGSFLNVVVYRFPAGKSIIRPGSHCPGCRHPIRWYDNVPVVSWFLLRGRCRDCGMAISWRYPAVEAATVVLFVLLGMEELLRLGGNLPERPIRSESGVLLLSRLTPQEAAAVYVYHLMLGCTLLAAALVEYDHPRLPFSKWFLLFWPAGVWGIAASLVWPLVHPVPAMELLREGWLSGLVDSLAGLAGGTAVGVLWSLVAELSLRLSFRKQPPPLARHWGPVMGSSALAGLYLGWQAGCTVAAVGGLVGMLGRGLTNVLRRPPTSPPPRPFLLPFVAWIGLGSLLWILFWKHWLAWSKTLF